MGVECLFAELENVNHIKSMNFFIFNSRFRLDRCAARIINYTISKVEKTLFGRDKVAVAWDAGSRTVATPGFQLHADAVEVLPCASVPFLKDIYQIAKEVGILAVYFVGLKVFLNG